MMIALLLAALPMIFWDQGPETAASLKQNGIEQVLVPAEKLQAWKTSGLSVRGITPAEWTALEEALAPGVDRQVQVASATRSPYLVANGWRFIRNRSGKYRYSLPAGKAALAVAETFAYAADATLQLENADLESAGKMLAFLRGVPPADLPGLADIAVIDDQHPLVGEVMNLLARRNLLFTAVPAPSPRFPINIRIGSKEYPEEEAANPSNFALKIRRQLTDDRRSAAPCPAPRARRAAPRCRRSPPCGCRRCRRPCATSAVSPVSTSIASGSTPEPPADQAREHRDVPLPLRRGAADDGDARRRADAHDRALVRHGGGRLDVVHDADAEVAALGAQPRLLAARRGQVERLERQIHAARIVAAVVVHGPAPRGVEAGGVRMPVGRDQVAPAQLHRVHAAARAPARPSRARSRAVPYGRPAPR